MNSSLWSVSGGKKYKKKEGKWPSSEDKDNIFCLYISYWFCFRTELVFLIYQTSRTRLFLPAEHSKKSWKISPPGRLFACWDWVTRGAELCWFIWAEQGKSIKASWPFTGKMNLQSDFSVNKRTSFWRAKNEEKWENMAFPVRLEFFELG